MLCNLYRDGNDCMGWHADDEPEPGNAPATVQLPGQEINLTTNLFQGIVLRGIIWAGHVAHPYQARLLLFKKQQEHRSERDKAEVIFCHRPRTFGNSCSVNTVAVLPAGQSCEISDSSRNINTGRVR